MSKALAKVVQAAEDRASPLPTSPPPLTSPPPGAGKKKATICAITKEDFAAHAKGQSVTIAGQLVAANPKLFSTGSLGWNASQRLTLEVNGVPVPCQVGLNITIIGSKEASK